MNNLRVGFVARVDFTPINKSKGFQKVIEPGAFRSAFVHFLPQRQPPMYIHPVWDCVEKEVPYHLHVSKEEYWICLKNKSPVQNTHMNIHQVVDNCAYLEKLIITQKTEIESLKNVVSEILDVLKISLQKQIHIVEPEPEVISV